MFTGSIPVGPPVTTSKLCGVDVFVISCCSDMNMLSCWHLVSNLIYQRHLVKVTAPILLQYFFGYKTELFSFQNNPKNLDLSCKTDLDLWNCLGRIKLLSQQNYIGLIVIRSHSREGKPHLIAESIR